MNFLHRVLFPLLAAFVFCLISPSVMAQSWLDDVGWTQLFNEYGAALEDGTGVKVTQVEAPNGSGNYMPNVNHAEFVGKNIVNGTPGGSNVTSSHATTVGRNFFSNVESIAPGLTDITVFNADDYLGRILNFNTGNDPLPDSFEVGNHSYIANGLTPLQAENILMRFDFVINRDNSVHAVGLNNGSGTAIPQLMAHSYNAISVGRRDGAHSQGTTTIYGAGRTRPHIIGAQSATSFTTPRVAGAAAMLKEAATGTDAANNEVIKALLFAGATKDEFADWDRTTTRPIDEKFGFGELNIYNSYKIHEGGQFNGGTPGAASDVGFRGWDFAEYDGTNAIVYEFEIFEDFRELSAALVWNLDVTDTNPGSAFVPTTTLVDLNLELLNAGGSVVDSSVGTVDNFEHLYFDSLAPGRYSFRISGDAAKFFGFAWRIDRVPGVTPMFDKFLDGLVSGGSLSDVFDSNNVDYELDPSVTGNPLKQKIEVIMASETPIVTPTSFGFRVEAAMLGGPEGDVVQTIELWNELDGIWELVDTRSATNSDSVALGYGTGKDLTRFVHPLTDEIISKITWTSPSFSGAPFTWSIDLDEAVWVIE